MHRDRILRRSRLRGTSMAGASGVGLTKVKAARVKLGTTDYAELAAFRRALREFLHFSEDAAARAGLSGRQYQAMLFLRGRQGVRAVSIDDLAHELLIKHNSAVGLADRLVREGLVTRGRAIDDRRRAELALTPLGRQILTKLASMHRVELRRIGPGLRRFFERMSTPPGAE
jgi:DNA-binding MarR family transcriptional regulator